MDFELIKVRVISAAYQLGSIIFLAVIGAVLSDEFRGVIVQNVGEGVWGTLIVLAFDAGVKHVRNLRVIAHEEKVGGLGARSRVTLI